MKSTLKLVICAVLPAAWKSSEKFVEKFIHELFVQSGCVAGVDTSVILSYDKEGRSEWKIFDILQREFPKLVLLPSNKAQYVSASLYLSSFKVALDMSADLVLEIDCSGAHDEDQIPSLISRAVRTLQNDPNSLVCVLSTRFASGGEDHFPKNRVLLSRLATLFSHSFLMLGKTGREFTDMSSGFEVFSGALLRRMFELREFKNWISYWWGPLYLFQTEARSFAFWIAQKEKVIVFESPIVFGDKFDRKLAPLTIGYLTRAFIGGLLLIWEGIGIRRRMKRLP